MIELSEMPRHRLPVAGDQQPAVPGGQRQHLEVVESRQPAVGRGSKVGFGQASKHSCHDGLVQVCVRLEADAHQRTAGVCLFASASFW